MTFTRSITLAALSATFAGAQTVPDLANPPGKPTLEQLKSSALDAEARLPAAAVAARGYFDISDAQRERLARFLPRTLLKLTRRERVHIVVIGDGMLDAPAAKGGIDPLLTSFPGIFAKLLANQFYFTGDVRVVRPDSPYAAKARPVMGPEIVLQPVAASSMVQAMTALTSEGFQGTPDLVLLALGFQDGVSGTPLGDVKSSLHGVIGAAKAKKVEVIVAGPMLQAAEPAEVSLGLTRGVAGVLREVSAKEKVLFSDLGDLARLIAPPSELAEGYRSFPVLARQYQSRLIAQPEGLISPATNELHVAMGGILFEDVMDGVPAVPWTIEKVTGKAGEPGKQQLSAEVRNTGKTPLRLTVLPLPTAAGKPQDASPELTLAPGSSQTIEMIYALSPSFMADELHVPLLVIAGSASRIEDLSVPVLPAGVTVATRTTFNHEGVFNPGFQITNHGTQKLAGSWEASFNGQQASGKFAIEPEGSETPVLKLGLGLKADAPVRQKVPLKLQLDLNGQKREFTRQIEIVRNLGLKQPVPLNATDGKESSVKLQFDADGQKLFVICDLHGLDLVDAGGRAFDAMLHLDARRYGQRLTPGAVDGIRIHGKAGDGDATVEKLASWAFGTGYAAEFDEKEIKATLSSTPDGLRRLTISLPRSYLYEHEWALNNGNSQLGVNFTLRAAGRTLFLTSSERHPDDVEALTVLELTDKPTLRATVKVE
jgi:hypothetical protein